MIRPVTALSLVLCAVFCTVLQAGDRIYIGTYTGKDSTARGIYLTELDPETGKLSEPALAVECASPAFLAKHPDRPLLYSVGEVWGDKTPGGAVYAFAIEETTGKLNALNTERVPGKGPTHLCTVSDRTRTPFAVVVACYGSGTVHALPILEDGRLGPCASTIEHKGSGPNEKRQKGPHAHAAYTHTVPGEVYILDLGLDKMLLYSLDVACRLKPLREIPEIKLPPGSGPRHAAFGRKGFYILNELDSTLCYVRLTGETHNESVIEQTLSTLPPGVRAADCANSTSEIFIHKSGRFLYASNRGHDSIALFSIDPGTGRLTFVETVPCGGKHPRSFDLSKDGRWLIAANRDTNNVLTFKIDPETGRLNPSGHEITVGRPVCVLP